MLVQLKNFMKIIVEYLLAPSRNIIAIFATSNEECQLEA